MKNKTQPSEAIEIIVPSNHKGRLDQALTQLLRPHVPDISRARVQALIKSGAILMNGSACRGSDAVFEGARYQVMMPAPRASKLIAEKIALNIVYEDDDLLVIDKEAGMVVHPAAGHHQGTLVHALLAHCKGSLSGIGGVMRPGIVHRLDKDTSGLMVVAKNDQAHQKLAAQFEDRTLSRSYIAFVYGIPKNMKDTIKTMIGRDPKQRQRQAVRARDGKEAITHYQVKKVFSKNHAVEILCTLETGRTHQIRVHMTHIRHPIIGDPLYKASRPGREIAFPRQALHAAKISFRHPSTGRIMRFSSPLPADMAALKKSLTKPLA